MFSRVLVTAVLLFGMGSAAEAGVAGNSFQGTLTNRAGETGSLCMAFDGDSRNWIFERQFRTDPTPVATEGAYMETDFFLFSFFNGQLGDRTMSGFQIFGFVIVNVAGPGGGIAAQGAAFLSTCVPSVPTAPAWPPTGEQAVSGSVTLQAVAATHERRALATR